MNPIELGDRADFDRRDELEVLTPLELGGWRGDRGRPLGWPAHLDPKSYHLVLAADRSARGVWLLRCDDYLAARAAWERMQTSPFTHAQLIWLKLAKVAE